MRRALPLAAAHINALLLVMCVLPFFGMLELTALFIIRSYLLLLLLLLTSGKISLVQKSDWPSGIG